MPYIFSGTGIPSNNIPFFIALATVLESATLNLSLPGSSSLKDRNALIELIVFFCQIVNKICDHCRRIFPRGLFYFIFKSAEHLYHFTL